MCIKNYNNDSQKSVFKYKFIDIIGTYYKLKLSKLLNTKYSMWCDLFIPCLKLVIWLLRSQH